MGLLGDEINDTLVLCEANVGTSVDMAVDTVKDAVGVVLLQKDLGMLGQGILEGRKTFTNILKYIKIIAGSGFGNVLSIVYTSALLPLLPVTSVQILLSNLLYDILCIVLPQDNVGGEKTLSPRNWSDRTLGWFILSFGSISSLLDIMAFLFLYYFLCPMLYGGMTYLNLTSPTLWFQCMSLFQIGWFLESMWTQVPVLYFLWARRIPFVQSGLSASVICAALTGTVAFTTITFIGGALLFGPTKLPFGHFMFLLTVALLYMLPTTVAKHFY